MAIRMVPCCKEKAVSVTVYVECPRKRRISGNRHHQRHNHYVHQTMDREVILDNKGASDHKGYNRRTQLLQYSQHLRKSAQSASTPSSPSSLKSTSSSDHNPTSQLEAAGHRKSKHVRTPACLGSCKIVVPNFPWCLTSFKAKKDRKKKKHTGSTSNKIKTMMTSFVMQKKKLQFLWSNYYSALRKRRY